MPPITNVQEYRRKKMLRLATTSAFCLMIILFSTYDTYFAKNKITIVSGAEYVESCPKKAKNGDTVTLTTCYVTDGELKITVNGEDLGTFEKENVYTFIMPKEDVEIKVKLVSNGKV